MSLNAAIETLSAPARLRSLELGQLATRIQREGNAITRSWEAARVRIENWLMERAMMSHIRKAFAVTDDEEGAQNLLEWMRRQQTDGTLQGLETGRLTSLNVITPGSHHQARAGIRPERAVQTMPSGGPGQPLLIYAVGGGFILPPAPRQLELIERLAEATGCTPILARHRLAPEAAFPGPVEDILEQYQAILDAGHPAENIILSGAMAGATLMLSACLLIIERGLPIPAGLLLFSPWGDLSLSSWSYITRSATTSSPFRMETAAFCARLYLQGENPTHPIASPVFADLTGMPPMAIHTSRHDMHFDDALKLVENAEDAGVTAHIRYWDSPCHHLERFKTRDARKSFSLAARFVTEVCPKSQMFMK